MADTGKRLAGPIAMPLTTAADLYTVPASTTAHVLNIHIANETGAFAKATLSIGADAAGKRLLKDFSVAANSVYDWNGFLVLAAAEKFQHFADTAAALTITISGVEVA